MLAVARSASPKLARGVSPLIPRHLGYVHVPLRGRAAESARWPAAGDMPSQVRAAARLMYAGAVLGAIGLLYYGFSTSPATVPQIVHVANPGSGAYRAGLVVGAALFAAVVAGLLLWVGWANKRRRNCGRVGSAVFFGLRPLAALEGPGVRPPHVLHLRRD